MGLVHQKPLQEVYAALCEKHPGALVLIKLGDFYEAYGDNAKALSEHLEITLTKRNDIPMAGVPAWNIEKTTDKLKSLGLAVITAERDPGFEHLKRKGAR